jgi:hypothetical protein
MTSARSFGSEAHFPRQIRLPPSRSETAVSFRETSSPIYCSMVALHSMLGPGANREPVFPSYRGATTLPACTSGPWLGANRAAITPCFRIAAGAAERQHLVGMSRGGNHFHLGDSFGTAPQRPADQPVKRDSRPDARQQTRMDGSDSARNFPRAAPAARSLPPRRTAPDPLREWPRSPFRQGARAQPADP